MRGFISGLVLLSAVTLGCNDTNKGAASPERDNTAVNVRDQTGTTKTPADQKENTADIKTTADIRQRILDADGLSINARNVKIITSDGRVTLRGPVDSAAERDAIGRMASEVAGDGKVDNQLELAN